MCAEIKSMLRIQFYQIVVVGELKLVIARQFISVASVLVLLVSIIAVPVVLLQGGRALVDEVAGPLVA